MFKFIKRFFGLDYNDNVAERNQVRPAVEDKGTIDVPSTSVTRPAVEDKGTLTPVQKTPKKPAKKAAPKKSAKK